MTVSRLSSAPRSLGLSFSPEFVALFQRVVLWIAIFHVAVQFCYSLPLEMSRTDVGRDMDIYYEAALRVKQGLPVYQPWPQYGVQMTPSRFFYSPAFLLLVRPLAELPRHDFEKVWLLLISMALWGYAICLSRLSLGKWDWKNIFIWGFVVDVVCLGHNVISIGQFEPLMWLLFGLAMTTRNRAGWLALATLVKIHPIWSLCLALSQGGKKAWKSAALFAIPALALSLALVGTHNWAMWWPSTSPVASQGTFNAYNWSLSFLVLRVFSWCGVLHPYGTLPSWAKGFLSLAALAGPLTTMYLARRQSPNLRLALVASAGALFAPLCWMAYYPLFLLPLAVWLGEKRHPASEALAN